MSFLKSAWIPLCRLGGWCYKLDSVKHPIKWITPSETAPLSNFSLALSGSPPVCKGHLQLHLLHLLLLSSWCAKAETTLCEWRVQTPPLEPDYNKHFSLLPRALPNTRVLLEQAFTSASLPSLLDLRPLTSFKIRGWRTSLLPLVFTQQVEGWAALVILLERLLLGRAAKVDWFKKKNVKFSTSLRSSHMCSTHKNCLEISGIQQSWWWWCSGDTAWKINVWVWIVVILWLQTMYWNKSNKNNDVQQITPLGHVRSEWKEKRNRRARTLMTALLEMCTLCNKRWNYRWMRKFRGLEEVKFSSPVEVPVCFRSFMKF